MWNESHRIVLGGTSDGRAAPTGTTIWEFDGDSWGVKTIQSKNGGIAGEPPLVAGRFKGQLRATPCVQPEPALV